MNTPSSKASLTTCIIYIIYYLLTAYHIIQRKQNNCLHFHLIREINTAMLWHFQFLSFNLPHGPANPPLLKAENKKNSESESGGESVQGPF